MVYQNIICKKKLNYIKQKDYLIHLIFDKKKTIYFSQTRFEIQENSKSSAPQVRTWNLFRERKWKHI